LRPYVKGRAKGDDDGLGFFFDSLPGLEILEDKEDDVKTTRPLAVAAKTAAVVRRCRLTPAFRS